MSRNIMIIAAHPDDEVIGCAGTIAHHVSDGDHVSIIFMTNGVGARNTTDIEAVGQRQEAAKTAAGILGAETPVFMDFPDNRMDSVDLLDIVQAIEVLIKKIEPEIIYTHFSSDLNIDHCTTHNAVMTACRPQSGSPVKAIYCFEVLSSTEWNSITTKAFNPNVFMNITDYWEQKYSALQAYSDEIHSSPHSRSFGCIKALAVLRGETNGFHYAEAFVLERLLVN